MIKDPNYLELFLKTGINFKERKIFFGYVDGGSEDNIDFESISMAIRAIDRMLAISNKQPIELHFTSYGGDPYQSLALVDKILESPCKFVFYGRGAIMSAATVIMAVCDERYLSKNATVMLHDGSDGFEGNTTDMQIYVKESERVQETYNEIYANNSWLKKNFWDAVVRRDLYLTADECITVGLADKIVHNPGRSKFRNRKKPNSSESNKISRLVKKFGDRIKLPILSQVEVHFNEDKYEEIVEYEHSEREVALSLEDEQGKRS